eukprot:765682-Hanusia_phi.AAC.2
MSQSFPTHWQWMERRSDTDRASWHLIGVPPSPPTVSGTSSGFAAETGGMCLHGIPSKDEWQGRRTSSKS